MRQELMPGSILPSERALAETFGVGRPTVREAIRELAERDLIDIVPGRGSFVAHPRAGTVVDGVQRWVLRRGISPRHILEARRLIEVEAAATAALRRSRHQVGLLGAVLDRLEGEANPVLSAQLDIAFHMGVARASANPVFELWLASLAPATAELIVLSSAFPGVTTARPAQHRAILAAIGEGEERAARMEMDAHLATGREGFGASYDEPLAESGTVPGPFDLDHLLSLHRLPAWGEED